MAAVTGRLFFVWETWMSYKFVLITDEYIDYLRKTEPRVMSNKAGERIYYRKYLGIIEELNGHKYFIPLSYFNGIINLYIVFFD